MVNKAAESPLSLFDILNEEYEHHARTHELADLYPGNEREKLRREAEAEFSIIPDERDRERRITEKLVGDFYRRLHEKGVERAALCISGGGIRSATFGLGVLQGLARKLDLDGFHYLSTVSGGGYIGSWFSAWAHRSGMSEVQKGLQGGSQAGLPLEPEPDTIFHLRRYSNYMSPRLGLLSSDTWALVGIFLRNLMLNWLVLIPLLLAVLELPRFWMGALFDALPAPGIVDVLFKAGFALGVVSVAYVIASRPSLENLTTRLFPPWIRTEKWCVGVGLGGLVVMAMTSTLYWSWMQRGAASTVGNAAPHTAVEFMLFGMALHLAGFFISALFAPQIRPSTFFGLRDLASSFITGAIGGLCLWGVARAFTFKASIGSGDLLEAALFACLGPPLFLLVFLAAATVFVGLASYHTSDADREWMARFGGWMLIAIAVWTILNGLVVFGPVGLVWLWGHFKYSLVSLFTGSGLISVLGARSAKTSQKPAGSEGAGTSKLPAGLLDLSLPYVTTIFLVLIIAALSLGVSLLTAWIGNTGWFGQLFGFADWEQNVIRPLAESQLLWHLHVVHYTPAAFLFAGFALLMAVGLVMGVFVNINKFSLHSAYRDRLIRAYLGASHGVRERRPNPFTGMDDQDNLQMHDLIRPIYQPDDFELESLVPRLIAKKKDPASKFVWDGLHPNTRLLLPKYRPDLEQTAMGEIQDAIACEFNRILHGGPLNLNKAFRELEAGPELYELIHGQPIVPYLPAGWLKNFGRRAYVEKLRINSLLLSAAFPREVRQLQVNIVEQRPLHVVNMALNLVKGEELAWRDRKAQTFTSSPLHVGSFFELGYRRSKTFGISPRQHRAISLGTSMAISGAAASPNMGYHSSPVVTFLMALFNVRLGWWFGNPGRAGDNTFKLPGPIFAPNPLIAETLGLTDNDHSYVYLSDGGHFENLGLYEMVLRRCRHIVVIDGSQDETFNFDSLGNALAKIRTDLGIPIVFESIPICRRPGELPTYGAGKEQKHHKYCAMAKIRYSAIDAIPKGKHNLDIDGTLIYIKPSVYGQEPSDVYNYATANPTFPHESTGDQMYSETQFESYRALGSFVVDHITGRHPGRLRNLDELVECVDKHLLAGS